MKSHCGACKFWDGREGDQDGACRRNAPHPVAADTEKEGVVILWPLTSRAAWCGEFTAAKPADWV